jgi:DNA replicative helicase MCM subunit Mcm2 (Cdc46/Mcm family)
MRNVVTVMKDKNNKTRIRFEILHKFTGDKEDTLLFFTQKEFEKDLKLDQRRREVDKIVNSVATKIQGLMEV